MAIRDYGTRRLRNSTEKLRNCLKSLVYAQFGYDCSALRGRNEEYMATGETAFISHVDCMRHDMGAHHPECPARLSAIEDSMISGRIADLLARYDAPLAEMEHLLRVHPRPYIEAVEAHAPARGIVHLDPDTAMCPATWVAALRAAGAGVLATDLVVSGKHPNAFCSVRPPGHHATRTRSMGFCIFNNIAVAAMHALEAHGLERVAIIDFDVHHGNGTEDIFSDDERVLMVSTFQHPFYPYSGTDDPAANMVNVPLAAGTGSDGFRAAVEQMWMPALDAFQPEMVYFSAGFDAHIEDDMAMLRFIDSDYAWVTAKVKDVVDRTGKGRVVSMLEGGYSLPALGRSVVQHLKVLGGL
jgi:acetoin utilization deacetylase AcuC-like enzyme